MRSTYNRKTSPKVIGGHVQRKNNHTRTACLGYVVVRVRPDKGYRHVVSKKDIHDFTDLIPDWINICEGSESIILDSGDLDYDGLYSHYRQDDTGTIWLSAWQKDLWVEFSNDYYQEHRWLIKIFGVVSDRKIEVGKEQESVYWLCYFSESQAKAFVLMHIFLHELGHHVDKFRSKKRNSSGEEFAENYADRRFHEIWPAYIDWFGDPCLVA